MTSFLGPVLPEHCSLLWRRYGRLLWGPAIIPARQLSPHCAPYVIDWAGPLHMSYHCLLRLRVNPLLLSTPCGRHRVLPLSGWAWGFLWHLPLACEACAGLGKFPSPTLRLFCSGASDRSAQASSGGLGVAGQPARSPHPWKVRSRGVSTTHQLGFSCLVGVRL